MSRVPFSQLPDSRKLKYIDFLSTRLKVVGNPRAPISITMFFPGDCKECLSFLDGPVFNLRAKSYVDVNLAYAIVPTSQTAIADAAIYFCAEEQGKLRKYFSVLEELKELGFPVTDVTNEISMFEYWKRKQQNRGLTGLMLKRWEENQAKFPMMPLTVLQLADISTKVFQECRFSPHTTDKFREYQTYIDELEATSLPALFIGTTYVLGLPNYENLRSLLRQERAKAIYNRKSSTQ